MSGASAAEEDEREEINRPLGSTLRSGTFAMLDAVWNPESRWTLVERGVATCIARRLGRNGFCWPSVRRIALDAGICERTAYAALKVLCEGDRQRGLPPLLVKQSRGSGRGNTYRLNPFAFPRAALLQDTQGEL